MLLIHHLFCFILFNCSGFGESGGSRGKVYLFFFSKCIIWSAPSGAPIRSSQRVLMLVTGLALNPLNQGQPFPGVGQSSGKGKANANSTNEAVWSRAAFDHHPWRTKGVTQVFSHLSGRSWEQAGSRAGVRAVPEGATYCPRCPPPAQPAPCLQRQVHKWERCHKAPLRVVVPWYLATALAEQRDHFFFLLRKEMSLY